MTSPCVPSIDCFDSIVFEPKILLNMCFDNLHSVRHCLMKIVNLTFRSSLIGWIVPTQVRCMRTKSPVKIERGEDINNTAKESCIPSYSSLWVVEGIVLTRILDHLTRMLQIAIANVWMNWYKYPKNGKSIRKQQPNTLYSNICPTYSAMSSRTLACISFFSRERLQFFWRGQRF